MAKLKALKASPFFKDLEDAEIKALAGIVDEKKLPPGTTVFLEGMMGESMYLLVSGAVKVSRMISEGEETVLTMLGPGDNFGEMAILDGGPRAANAITTEDTVLFVIKRANFLKMQDEQPKVCLQVLWALVGNFAKRIRENAEQYKELLSSDGDPA